MKRILVIGAGRSATALIRYLLEHAAQYQWHVRVGDLDAELAKAKVAGFATASALYFNIEDQEQARLEIGQADLVISLLPARFHIKAAHVCLELQKDLFTASYISGEMKALAAEVSDRGLLFLNECGLDPGLDHMTAMAALDQVRSVPQAHIHSFKSYTGGLVAPESDNNPWHYKFTWNPRNVVLAGRQTAQFMRDGKYKYIPYHRLFTRLEEIEVDGYGKFEGYANRDSLQYRGLYGLQDIDTMIRGTLRRPGFSEAWNVFVQLGLTDDSYVLEGLASMTYRQFVNTFLYHHPSKSIEEKLCDYLNIPPDGVIMQKLSWLGIFKDENIGMTVGSPAQVLQHLLERKWGLAAHDKDMIVMQHQISYSAGSEQKDLLMSLVSLGDDQDQTAMAKTVGWPLAIAAKLRLTDQLQDSGVVVPVTPLYYKPILKELEQLGVQFIEQEY